MCIRDRIKAQLQARIQNGALKSGDKLPSERELCALFNTTRITCLLYTSAALAIAPLVLTACAVALVLWGESKIVASTVAIIWGFAFALIPVCLLYTSRCV